MKNKKQKKMFLLSPARNVPNVSSCMTFRLKTWCLRDTSSLDVTLIAALEGRNFDFQAWHTHVNFWSRGFLSCHVVNHVRGITRSTDPKLFPTPRPAWKYLRNLSRLP